VYFKKKVSLTLATRFFTLYYYFIFLTFFIFFSTTGWLAFLDPNEREIVKKNRGNICFNGLLGLCLHLSFYCLKKRKKEKDIKKMRPRTIRSTMCSNNDSGVTNL